MQKLGRAGTLSAAREHVCGGDALDDLPLRSDRAGIAERVQRPNGFTDPGLAMTNYLGCAGSFVQSAYYDQPEQRRNGIIIEDGNLRIDYTQHAVSALVQYLEYTTH